MKRYVQGKTRGQISELLVNSAINQACANLENTLMMIFTEIISFIFNGLTMIFRVRGRRVQHS